MREYKLILTGTAERLVSLMPAGLPTRCASIALQNVSGNSPVYYGFSHQGFELAAGGNAALPIRDFNNFHVRGTAADVIYVLVFNE